MANCPKCESKMTHVEDDRRPMLRKVIHTYLCPSCGHSYQIVEVA